MSALCVVVLLATCAVQIVFSFETAFAFAYTTTTNDFFNVTSSEGYKSIYVYAGDVETICRGVQGTAATKACYFEKIPGHQQNAWVYYTDSAKQIAAKYASAGFDVYLNFDGRIGAGPKGSNTYVANFSDMNATAIQQMAEVTAGYVCNDPNVKGLGWDVEPFNNNQVPYFTHLTALLEQCDSGPKQWSLFAFPSDFNQEMWHTFGTVGVVMDSSYDLTGVPCMCVEPKQYQSLLTTQLTQLKADALQFDVKYQILLSGSGTTNIYTEYAAGDQCIDGGPVYNKTCPYTMAAWMTCATNAMDTVNVKDDPHFIGIGVYDYTSNNNGGFMPSVPNDATLQVIKDAGYF